MPRIKVDDTVANSPTVAVPTPVPQEVPPMPVVTPEAPKIKDKTNVNDTDGLLKLKSGNPLFSAFCAFPDAINFEGEDPDEKVLLLLRAHVVTNIKWILITIGLLLVPLIIFPLLASFNMLSGVGGGTGFIFTILWVMGTFTYAFLSFLYWYFNAYIVTNERIIDIDWYSIIYHQTNSTRISKIQDVSSTHSGVFASMFDYGNVHIETAAEESNFLFEDVPHPDLISQKIQDLMETEEKQWEKNPNENI